MIAHVKHVTLAITVFSLASCAPPPPQAEQSPEPERLTTDHLPNAVRVTDKVISGGLPDGEAGFQELASLGVKTVISVDGAQPEVELAKKHGLRYVHLPHGYDGIPTGRVNELAKAVRDLEGPIYVHCHHGKHRSPAAASVACVAAGMVEPNRALDILKLAGTSEKYRGLYQSAESARPLDKPLLDALDVEFRETVELPPMAEAMIDIEHTHDHLLDFSAGDWALMPDHPDLDPAHEALLLREHFTELLRADYVQHEPEEFRRYLNESEAAARELENGLNEWKSAKNSTSPPALLGNALDRVTANCGACHAQFRDVPLSEK